MYETLVNLSRDSAGGDFVSITLNIAAPFDVSYTVGTFLNDEKFGEEKEFARRVDMLGGVEANFECNLYGKIAYPDSLKDYPFQLLVNPLEPSRYLYYAENNCIGDGWYYNDFLFRVHLNPQMTNDLFRSIALKKQFQLTEFDNNEMGSDIWATICLHLVEIATDGGPGGGETSYRIRRLYA